MRNLTLLVKSCSIQRLNSRTVGGASTLLTSIRLSRLAPLNWLPKMLWMLAWNFAPDQPASLSRSPSVMMAKRLS